MSTTKTRLLTVPPGTKSTRCQRCGMSIYWIRDNGQNKPIDCSVIGGNDPSESSDPKQTALFGETEVRVGKGKNHLDDCRFERSER